LAAQRLLAVSFGPSSAPAHRSFAEWTRIRVCAKLHRLVLDEFGLRGELSGSKSYFITDRTVSPVCRYLQNYPLTDTGAFTPTPAPAGTQAAGPASRAGS
jgi:hypothetical protein